MEEHLHAHRLGHHRQLGADGAVAHDAQRLAADFVGVLGALEPAAAVGGGVLGGHAAQQQDGFGQHQLGHRARVGVRRVEDHHATLARRVQVHLVGADAKAAHGHELLRGGEHVGRQLRARTDADEVHVGDLALELLAFQRARHGLHIGVARVAQHFECGRMDAFEQQELDLRFIQRRFGHGQALSSQSEIKASITADSGSRYSR